MLRIHPSLPDESSAHMEPVLSAFHSLKRPLSLEIAEHEGKVCFFIRCPDSAVSLVESQLYAQYPHIDIERGEIRPSGVRTHLRLSKHELFSIKTDFGDVDPVCGIVSALGGHVQIRIKPYRWFPRLRFRRRPEEPKEGLKFLTTITLHAKNRRKLKEIAGAFKQFSGDNSFKAGRKSRFLLTVKELSALWHFPTVQIPSVDWILSRNLEPPVNLPKDGTLLGESVFRGERQRFSILPDDRRRHVYMIGKSGSGKSTLLLNMIHSDIVNGKGVGVIDPHGDLIDSILRIIPKSRTNDVILFDPADTEYPLSFNILSATPDQYPIVVSGLMSVFTKLFPDVWSGRMEYILRNSLFALIGQNTLLGIVKMFTDDAFRKKVVDHISDPLVKSFWTKEYPKWSEKYRTEAIAPIQNKVGQLLSVPMIRNIIGQKGTLSLREAMDAGKIILVNLSKGNIGEDNSAFLGSMLVTKFQLDAMSRADIPESERRDFSLFVDEFQNFATESFGTMLSEARKYRLNLTIAHQYMGQLEDLKDAVFGNVGTIVCFQVGSEDASALKLQLEEMVTANDLISLPRYRAYVRLLINGISTKPFSIATLPPPTVTDDRTELVKSSSRERYCETRKVVEDKINRWLQSA